MAWYDWVAAVAQYLVQFLEAVLVWPLAVILVGGYFLRNHRGEIDNLLKRVRGFKGGPFEFDAQTPPEQVAPPTRNVEVALTGNAATGSVGSVGAVVVEHSSSGPQAASSDAGLSSKEKLDRIKKALDDCFFESIYNRIWGTQWDALVELERNNGKVSTASLNKFFVLAMEKVKNDRTKFDTWIRFLVILGLVEHQAGEGTGAYVLTQKGRDFLAYIRRTFPDPLPPRAY